MNYPVMDCAVDTTSKLARIKALGYTAIIRYDYRAAGWKQVKPAEAKAIADHGLQLGIVYEGAGDQPSAFSHDIGVKDATYSRHIAPDRGQPAGMQKSSPCDRSRSTPQGPHHMPLPRSPRIHRSTTS
jgi:hypothetical protein